jgi:hypothetical protein
MSKSKAPTGSASKRKQIGDDVPLSAMKKKSKRDVEGPSFKKGGFISTLLLHQGYITDKEVPDVVKLVVEGGMNVSFCCVWGECYSMMRIVQYSYFLKDSVLNKIRDICRCGDSETSSTFFHALSERTNLRGTLNYY